MDNRKTVTAESDGNLADQPEIRKIENEYTKIDRDWLRFHYRITIGMVIFAFVVECMMSVLIINSSVLKTTVPIYLMKYIVTPTIVNLACVLVDVLTIRYLKLSQRWKITIISLMHVIICFVLFTVHSTFVTTYFFFMIPIMVTTVYADYILTLNIGISSVLLLGISELAIRWNSEKESVFQSDMRMMNFIVAIAMLVTFTAVCLTVIHFERKKNEASIQLEKEKELLKEKLHMDDLTGTFNRKALQYSLADVDCKKESTNYIMVMTDMDNFKGVNDTWGHHVGDRCLIEFARILLDNAQGASIFRYGGDEFCILFHNTEMEDVVSSCNMMREKLNKILLDDYQPLRLTASFGLASLHGEMDSQQLIRHSDHALYRAKKARNSVYVYKNKEDSLPQSG